MRKFIPPFLGGLCIVILAAATYAGLFDAPEMRSFDWLMRTRPSHKASPDIVITRDIRDPARVLTEFNNQLHRILKGRFVTGQCVVVHQKDGFLEGASAGHLPLLVFDTAAGTTGEFVASSGPPLGLMENIPYETVKRPFGPGDRVFMYTDGWLQTRNRTGKEFGMARPRSMMT